MHTCVTNTLQHLPAFCNPLLVIKLDARRFGTAKICECQNPLSQHLYCALETCVHEEFCVQNSLLRCLQTLRSWCWSIFGTQWPKSLEWLVRTGKWKSVHMGAPSKTRPSGAPFAAVWLKAGKAGRSQAGQVYYEQLALKAHKHCTSSTSFFDVPRVKFQPEELWYFDQAFLIFYVIV